VSGLALKELPTRVGNEQSIEVRYPSSVLKRGAQVPTVDSTSGKRRETIG